MDSVIKKKKKSLLPRIIGRIKNDSSPHGQDGVVSDIPLDDVSTNSDDIVTIASRRNELKKAKHGNTDAVVTFNGNNI